MSPFNFPLYHQLISCQSHIYTLTFYEWKHAGKNRQSAECLPWWNGQEHKDDDDFDDDEHDDDVVDDEHGVESVCATCRRLTGTDRSCPARLCSTSLPHHLYNTLQVFLYFYFLIFLYFYISTSISNACPFLTSLSNTTSTMHLKYFFGSTFSYFWISTFLS